MNSKILLLLIFSISLAFGQTVFSNPSAVVMWNNAMLSAIAATKTPPTIASRALSIMHTAIYDSWACYDAIAVGTRFKGSMRQPSSQFSALNKQTALSYAAFRVMNDLFPSAANSTSALMLTLGYDPTVFSQNTSTPQGLGCVCAQAVLDFRHGDGSNQLGTLRVANYTDYTYYVPINTLTQLVNLNYWQPLNTSTGAPQAFITPQWGLLTTFARKPQVFSVAAPAKYPSSQFTTQCSQLLTLSAGLNPTTKVIAEYWVDGPGTVTPPGHWCVLAQFVSSQKGFTLDNDVKMFFALTGGLMDAGIYAWVTKRAFNYVRPITAIRNLYSNQTVSAWAGPGKGTQNIQGSTWTPYLPTPSFPEHVSGHSTFSAAAAQVLQSFTNSSNFGYSYTFPAGNSTIEPGITPPSNVILSYPTFFSAANDAGISRRYGGIHFYKADYGGRTLGQQVGAQAWATAQSYFTGNANSVKIQFGLLFVLLALVCMFF